MHRLTLAEIAVEAITSVVHKTIVTKSTTDAIACQWFGLVRRFYWSPSGDPVKLLNVAPGFTTRGSSPTRGHCEGGFSLQQASLVAGTQANSGWHHQGIVMSSTMNVQV